MFLLNEFVSIVAHVDSEVDSGMLLGKPFFFTEHSFLAQRSGDTTSLETVFR